jgi:hypothetical protein
MSVLATVGSGAWFWLRDTATVGGVAGFVYAGINFILNGLKERPILEWTISRSIHNSNAERTLAVNISLTVYNRCPAQLELRGFRILSPPSFEIPSYNDRHYGNFFGVWKVIQPYAPYAPEFPSASGGFDLGIAPLPKIEIEAVLVSRGTWLWATRRRFTIAPTEIPS